MDVSEFLLDAFRENKTCVCVCGEGGRGSCSPVTLTLKNSIIASDYHRNEPPPEFIRPSFL